MLGRLLRKIFLPLLKLEMKEQGYDLGLGYWLKKKKEKSNWKWQDALSRLKFDNTLITSLF